MVTKSWPQGDPLIGLPVPTVNTLVGATHKPIWIVQPDSVLFEQSANQLLAQKPVGASIYRWDTSLMPHEERRILACSFTSSEPTDQTIVLITVERWCSPKVQAALNSHPKEAWPIHVPLLSVPWTSGCLENLGQYALWKRFRTMWETAQPFIEPHEDGEKIFFPQEASDALFLQSRIIPALTDQQAMHRLQQRLTVVRELHRISCGWLQLGPEPLHPFTRRKLEQAIHKAGWQPLPFKAESHGIFPEDLTQPVIWLVAPDETAHYPLWLAGLTHSSPVLRIDWEPPVSLQLWEDVVRYSQSRHSFYHWIFHTRERYADRLAALKALDPDHPARKTLATTRRRILKQLEAQSPATSLFPQSFRTLLHQWLY